jgi:uncharacterized MAPEG superfamily protein
MAVFTSLESLMLITLFTALMWIPYTVSDILSNGLWPKLSYQRLNVPMHGWAERAKVARAHMLCPPLRPPPARAHPDAALPRSRVGSTLSAADTNAMENLPLFASMVFLCFAYEVDGVDDFACLYLYSRLLHWPFCVFTDKIPVARTLCFFGGWAAIILMFKACADKCNADKAAAAA